MLKTLNRIEKLQSRRKIPRTIQQCIPVNAIYSDGIFVSGRLYSKSFQFEDINYSSASEEDKENILFDYMNLLNSIEPGCIAQITINNREMDQENFRSQMLMDTGECEHPDLRKELNDIKMNSASGSNSIVQEKYITITVEKNSIEEAVNAFARMKTSFETHFSRLSSHIRTLNAQERLLLLKDFYRNDDKIAGLFDCQRDPARGRDFRDYLCPSSLSFENDYFTSDGRYGRVLVLREYPNYGDDSLISELTTQNKNVILSITLVTIPIDETVRELQNILLGMETNIANYNRKQNENSNYMNNIPYTMKAERDSAEECLNDVVTRDQRMYIATVTLVHMADTLEELNQDTEVFDTIARGKNFSFDILKMQQLDALNTVLPYGLRHIKVSRTLFSENCANLVPFRALELMHPEGVFYGLNRVSGNMVIADKRRLMNANSFILGVSGSGKSFTAKKEILNQIAHGDCDILIIDPEREYSAITRRYGGQIIHISSDSDDHINALDLNMNYSENANDPLNFKFDFLVSFIEQAIAPEVLNSTQMGIIDMTMKKVYKPYIESNFEGIPPTLAQFHEVLESFGELGKNLADSIRLYCKGTFDLFANQTNVDINNSLICYDILDLSEKLQPLGMLVVLDSIFNRITKNRQLKRQTFIIIDEIYLMFLHEHSAQFLSTLWKRVRKYGASCTGITQNVQDLLKSEKASTMLSNSEFVVMLNQSSNDRDSLQDILDISDEQAQYITNVAPGSGLIRFNRALIPFADDYPKDCETYRLMNTTMKDMM